MLPRVNYGPYEVLGELGRGGMGLVYRARTVDGRQVALKVILSGRASKSTLERFARERRLLASLTMAEGFVPVLDAGEGPSGPYLVMPMVTGGTLRARLRKAVPSTSGSRSLSASLAEGQAMPIDEAVEVVRQMSLAVGKAHRKGIVHRDLKPENVLFTDDGRPLVSDLGLAKHFSADTPGASQTVALTNAGEAKGTFGYMAPEQLNDAKSVGPPADVFALGVILYECVAGSSPFAADSAHGVCARVALGEYEPLAKVRRDCPPWLARVVDKALDKRAADRWSDGIELASALAAGPEAAVPGRGSRRLLLGLGAGLVLAATAGGLAALGPREGVAPVPSATEATPAAPVAPRPPSSSSSTTGPRAIPASCEPFARAPGARLVALCGDLTLKHDGRCFTVALLPDGRLASAGDDGPIKLWDLAAILRGERPVAESQLLRDHGQGVFTFAASPDGRRGLSASADQTLVVWDLTTGKLQRRLEGHESMAWGCAWSPDGERVVSSSWDQSVRVWDPDTGKELGKLAQHGSNVPWCAFAPDGRVVSIGEDGKVLLWDWQRGGVTELRHDRPAFAGAFVPGDRLLSVSEDRTLRLWDLKAGASARTFTGASGALRAVAASPDGRRALTGGRDDERALRLWDLETGQTVRRLAGHASEVYALALHGDGRHAVSGSSDGSVRLWDLEAGREAYVPDGHRGPVLALCYTADGRRLWSGGEDGTCRLWDVATGREAQPTLDAGEHVRALALSKDEARLLVGGERGALRLWDTARREVVQTFPGHVGPVRSVALSPDGTRALSIGDDKKLRLWDVATGTIDETIPHESFGRGVAFMPDGRRYVSVEEKGALRVWDPASSKEPDPHGISFAEALALTADGERAFVSSPGGSGPLFVIDLESPGLLPRALTSAKCHGFGISRDGRRLVTVLERALSLWEPERPEDAPVASIDLAALGDHLLSAAVSGDGETFAVGTRRGVVLVFEPR